MANAKACASCVKTVSNIYNFCSTCGAKLLEIPACTCGKVLFIEDSYCSMCGRKRLHLDEIIKNLKECA